jgi:hypothetical protein
MNWTTDLPSAVKTDTDLATFCEQLKNQLIADHNASRDWAERELIRARLAIVGQHGYAARKACGAGVGGLESEGAKKLQAIKEAAKAKPFKIRAVHKDIDASSITFDRD